MYVQNFRLWRGLTFTNLWFRGSSRNFSCKVWGRGKSDQFSPRKSYFSSIRQVFSLQSFHCTVLPRLRDPVADWISGQMRVTGYSTRVSGWTLQNPGVTREMRASWKVCSDSLSDSESDFKLVTVTHYRSLPPCYQWLETVVVHCVYVTCLMFQLHLPMFMIPMSLI